MTAKCGMWYRSGDVGILLLPMGCSSDGYHWHYIATLNGIEIARATTLRTPKHWSNQRVAEAAVACLIDADDEMRTELGWAFNPDDLLCSTDSYDTGSETRYRITTA